MGRNLERLQRQREAQAKELEIEKLKQGPNQDEINALRQEIATLKTELDKRDIEAYKKQFQLSAEQLKVDLEVSLRDLKDEVAALSAQRDALLDEIEDLN